MEVFLVENSALIVKRLREMLSALPGVIVLGHAAAAGPAIHEILKRKPQIVLLDLELDQGSGFDVLSALRAAAPEIDVYMLTNDVSQPLRELAARHGAKGFYDKTRDFETLRDLIAKRAVDGQDSSPTKGTSHARDCDRGMADGSGEPRPDGSAGRARRDARPMSGD